MNPINQKEERIIVRGLKSKTTRFVAIIASGLLLALGLNVAPANAVTEMAVSLSISRVGPLSDSAATISMFLPTNQFDGQGYLDNGARIEVRFFGDDTFSDDFLGGPFTFSKFSNPHLVATPEGITGNATIHPASHFFDEDSASSCTLCDGVDEVYAEFLWIDGAGSKIKRVSRVVKGQF
ncbi:hypothetical protein AB0J63_47015 [Streptosporangium canum]|uniref:hypothetical protein n=1 Tax=Streptosporangium canum TaxID=324952 RepID=UPI00343B1ADF